MILDSIAMMLNTMWHSKADLPTGYFINRALLLCGLSVGKQENKPNTLAFPPQGIRKKTQGHHKLQKAAGN